MPPLSLMIKPVSGACNMRCAYCFYEDVSSHRAQKSHGSMSLDLLETLVRRAFSYADERVLFAFQGGEPTLAGAAFYRELIRLQRKYNSRGIAVFNSLQTNGYQLEDELIDLFAREKFLIGVSLDGTEALHDQYRVDQKKEGTYDCVKRTINRLHERGVEINILCVVNGAVARNGVSVFRALAPYGFIQFIPCMDGLDGKPNAFSLTDIQYGDFLIDTFAEYAASIRGGRYVSVRNFDNWIGMLLGQPPESCAMAGRCGVYYLIEGDGGVYPCDFYVLDEWKLGNVKDSSFARLDKSPVARRFLEMSYREAGECGKCEWKRLCHGGCRRDREPTIDGLLGLNRFCMSFRRFFDRSYADMLDIAEGIKRGKYR